MDLEQAERQYTERRNAILARINAGECSASMSGIEYYPYPWAELPEADREYYRSLATR